MHAKRCDKCKTFYLPINPPDEHDILRVERETLLEGVITYTDYDLCGECTKKLIEWIEEGEE